jgi:predicted aconitase
MSPYIDIYLWALIFCFFGAVGNVERAAAGTEYADSAVGVRTTRALGLVNNVQAEAIRACEGANGRAFSDTCLLVHPAIVSFRVCLTSGQFGKSLKLN